MMKNKPTLAQTLAKFIEIDASEDGIFAFIPWLLIICCISSFVISFWVIPENFFIDEKWDISTSVYSALLTFNGILLSLGWFAFSKTQDTMLKEPMFGFLKRNDLIGHHINFIEMVHLVLVFSTLVSVVGLISTLIKLPLNVDKLIFGIALTLTIYSIPKALSATRLSNQLLWDSIYGDYELDKEKVRKLDAVK